jgi:hypothetical protein
MALFSKLSWDSVPPLPLSALILAGAIVAGSTIGSYAMYSIRALDNTLTVTGSTKERVMADSARWRISVDEIVVDGNQSQGFARVAHNVEIAKAFLIKNGFAEDSITIAPAETYDIYSNDNSVRKVTVSQALTVTSDDVQLVENVALKTATLSQSGVRFSAQQPQYLISQLPDLRVSLLGKATEDAKARAEKIAESMDQNVGRMKSATSGVVQVTAPDSIDFSDYGQYDTSTIEKDVMLSVRVTYTLK